MFIELNRLLSLPHTIQKCVLQSVAPLQQMVCAHRTLTLMENGVYFNTVMLTWPYQEKKHQWCKEYPEIIGKLSSGSQNSFYDRSPIIMCGVQLR